MVLPFTSKLGVVPVSLPSSALYSTRMVAALLSCTSTIALIALLGFARTPTLLRPRSDCPDPPFPQLKAEEEINRKTNCGSTRLSHNLKETTLLPIQARSKGEEPS